MSDTDKTSLSSADIMRLMELLPHRYPFLLIDRIEEMRDDESCIGIKNVTINEPHFQGHFPENPVMPGVLILEAMAQTAGALCIHHSLMGADRSVVYLMTIDKARFRKPVVPGDQLKIHVSKQRKRASVWKFGCEAMVDGNKVAEAVISATVSSSSDAAS